MFLSALSTETTSGVLAALGAGLAAGLGVAIPLGAIGVLLLHEGMRRGLRPALSAASGVAVVDLVYATLAVLAGGAVSAALSGVQAQVRLVGAAVLGGLAIHGLFRTLQSQGSATVASASPPGNAFWRFAGLTAVNPLTALYFTVLAASLGELLRGPLSATAFVLGIFIGSWAWQSILAITGTMLGFRLPDNAQTSTAIIGYSIVLALAIALALSA